MKKLLFALLIALSITFTLAPSYSAVLGPPPKAQFLDASGDPLASGQLFAYEAGTSTPKDTFTDAGGLTANANPVVLDSAGRADIWLGSGSYKMVLKDSAGATIWTVDNVSGDIASEFGSAFNIINTNTTVDASYKNSVIVASLSPTLSLLPASEGGEGFLVMVRNDGTGTVTIDPDGSETINGASTIDLPMKSAAIIGTNGTFWYSFGFAIEQLADMQVLGNVSGATAYMSGIQVNDDDAFLTASATTLATSESIQQYASAQAVQYASSYANGSGRVLQTYSSSLSGTLTLSSGSTIPQDATIPQNTEGTEVLAGMAITPLHSDSVITFLCNLFYTGVTNNPNMAAALFVDSTASAIAASANDTPAAGEPSTMTLTARIQNTSTVERTYKLRAGPVVATSNITINPYFSTTGTTNCLITEVAN